MACYHPLVGFKNKYTGGWTCNPSQGYVDIKMTIPCGQCIGCRLERARQWAVRCMHEASLHTSNSFLTLTYSDDKLPPNGSLRKSDMTEFLKRLRYHIQPTKIRYLQCGEYGEETNRPHHHMILFGYNFPDLELIKNGKNKLHRSDMLDNIWTHGHCSIGDVTFESAGYVARYTVNKMTGPDAEQYYEDQGIIPPYLTMSRRSGIAAGWIEKFESDVYPSDNVVIRGNVTCLPPTFYDKKLEESNKSLHTRIKGRRLKKAQENPESENVDRLMVREEVLKLKLAQNKRYV